MHGITSIADYRNTRTPEREAHLRRLALQIAVQLPGDAKDGGWPRTLTRFRLSENMRCMTRTLQTVDDVINKLGGTVRTSELAGVRPSQVSGWRSAKRLGTKSYLILQRELESRGYTAPSHLWGIEEPPL